MTDSIATTLYFGPWYRKSPFFEATRRAGCQAYDIYNHMYLPGLYDDAETEYDALLHGATLWDVSVERQVEITGKDGFKFTNYLVTRDLTKCAVGQGKYVLLCNEQGGIINDPVLLRLDTNHFWLSLANSDTLLWAQGVAVHSGMDVEIREPDVSPLQVQGPKSKQVVRDLFGSKVLDLPYYSFLETEVEGIPVIVTRTGWSAEVGYEIYLRDGARGEALWDRVMAAGKPYGLRPIGPSELRRIEAGILNYGSDMTLDDNPYEVGLGWVVDLDKRADFVGRAALRRIKKEGVRKKLVGVEIHGPKIFSWLSEPWPVKAGRNRVGRLTALTFSPRLEKNIGYAMVPVENSKLGTRLAVVTPDGDREATVVRRPFVDPKKDIPKS